MFILSCSTVLGFAQEAKEELLTNVIGTRVASVGAHLHKITTL